ncbi:DUF1294 domain-containing protein [Acidovorax carolinensis]|uniref:DUF1294 domain-containing protein n=1 Tax=Acidovorax carolinensis TaxID=553814 RepID=UPI000B5F66C4|nr:DUF1294 domain-containing protein [Acidovorax carolinensis]ART48465.1 hypothetical protein CBP33_10255 [Acidovorax carolinensis]
MHGAFPTAAAPGKGWRCIALQCIGRHCHHPTDRTRTGSNAQQCGPERPLAHQRKTLHLLNLAGGWPGAWWARQTLRHPSRKTEFRAVYWLTVVLHCTAVRLQRGCRA